MLTVSTQLSPEDDLASFSKMLSSVAFADEILVFNLERTDADFVRLIRSHHAREIKHPIPKVVEHIRSKQIQLAKGEWVLIMDHDEVASVNLITSLKTITSVKRPTYSAFYLNRLNYSLGFPLKHGGFGIDYIPRLFYKPNFVAWSREIHGLPKVRGEFGYLKEPLLHYKDASLNQMVSKTNRYTDVEAQQFFSAGTPPVTALTLLRKTIMEFIRRYIFKTGFLDGKIGLIQAVYQSYAIFLRYAKLYELQNKMKIEHNR